MPELQPQHKTGTAPLGRAVLSVIEVPIACGVGYACFHAGYRLLCRVLPCYDVSGLWPAFLALLASIVLAVGYWIVMAWKGMPLRRRLFLDGAAALLGIGVYVVPQIIEMRAEALDRAQAQMQAGWYEALKRDAHAPPGVPPPMLDVVDDGTSAVVTNKGPKRHFFALARVVPDGTASRGWRRCAMTALTVGGFEFHTLAPGESARFVLDPRCANAFAGAAIEYRVDSDPPLWWSDSAIAEHEGRPFPPAR